MAQDGSGPTGENGRHPTAPLIKSGPPHRIDAAVDPVQPSPCQAVLNGLGANAELEQLPPRDHSMLLRGKRPCPASQNLIG